MPASLDPQPDLVIIGNAMTRGNPCEAAHENAQRISPPTTFFVT